MKVLINGHCVSLQLTAVELKQFTERGMLESRVKMDDQGEMIYTIEKSQSDRLQISFAMNEFRVFVPKHIAKNWLYGQQRHLEYFVRLGPHNFVRLLLEKAPAQDPLQYLDRKFYLQSVN